MWFKWLTPKELMSNIITKSSSRGDGRCSNLAAAINGCHFPRRQISLGTTGIIFSKLIALVRERRRIEVKIYEL
jgi:hypothetical protein